MITMRRFGAFAAACALMAAVTGCGSHKPAVSQASAPVSVPVSEMGRAMAADAAEWTAVSMPVKLSLLSPASASLSGRAGMVRGESLHISLRVLGMEVAYLYADRDSIYAVDKIHRYFLAESTSALASRYDVTLENLQDMMLGRPFAPGGTTLSPATLGQYEINAGKYGERDILMLSPRYSSGLNSLCIVESADDGKPVLSAMAIEAGDSHSLICRYSNPVRTVAAGTITSEAEISTNISGTDFTGRIRWSVGDAKWNEKADRPSFRKPGRNYTRVSAGTLLEMLGKK